METQKKITFVHTHGIAKKAYKKSEPHIRIVTFNVHFGENPSSIVREINSNENLKKADIILLQEIESHNKEKMPRAGVIAEELDMHYVYAPARSLKNKLGTHGLATLSRFPILDAETIPLPPFRLTWHTRNRIALNVSVDADGTLLKVTNVHLDTLINAGERLAQLKPVIDRAVNSPGDKVIIGGDFNTLPIYFLKRVMPAFLHDQRKAVDLLFAKNGFKTHVEEIRYTMRRGYIRFKLDSIYIRGAEASKYGLEKNITISDHLPLWVDIIL